MKRKNGFTLIELIAVLVILAILALIVTPLVMNIIRKARISADKRSIDAYGRSIELAIATYLLDEGKFPTSIDELTIEYSGDRVVCETSQLNSDSSVYLAGCTVSGRSTGDYTYGKEEVITYDAYNVGDEVTYNNVNYYVIKDSSASEATVTMLKAEPLTTTEVNKYGIGHVNMYNCSEDEDCYQIAYDQNGYGGMAYYTSTTCNSSEDKSGCTADYEQSEIKYVVDAWKLEKAPAAIEARLLTLEDLNSLGYNTDDACIQSGYCDKTAEAPGWLHKDSYSNWTSSQYWSSSVWVVGGFGLRGYDYVPNLAYVVRPVITLNKSAIEN